MLNEFLTILNDAKYFSLRIQQNYLVVTSAKRYSKFFSCITIKYCMSEESIENITKSDNTFSLLQLGWNSFINNCKN